MSKVAHDGYRESVAGRADVQDTPELVAYYEELDRLQAGALWTVANKIEPWQPKSESVPILWRFRDVSSDGTTCIWQDGLDIPLVNAMEAGFYAVHPNLNQVVTHPVNDSTATWAGTALRPQTGTWSKAYSPLFKYEWAQTYESLLRYS